MSEDSLFELPAPQPPKTQERTSPQQARVLRPVRNQVEWVERDLDASLPDDHPARAIWAFLERLDLSAFYASIKSVLGHAGHPTTDPQVLLALWLLATSEGIGSARHVARLCQEHDAYRWLRGGVPINYHTLSDFRVAHQQEMDDLLTEILAAMMDAGLVKLHHVAQDGLKVRASAGKNSFHRAFNPGTLSERGPAAGSGPGCGTGAARSQPECAPRGGASAGGAGPSGAGRGRSAPYATDSGGQGTGQEEPVQGRPGEDGRGAGVDHRSGEPGDEDA